MNEVDSEKYAFGDDGCMLPSWLDRGRNPLDGDATFLEAGDHHSSADGVLKTGSWLLASSPRLWDAAGMSGVVTGRDYSGYDQLWLYFDKGGRKARIADGRIRQKEIEGRTYGLDEYGIMAPCRAGTVRDGDKGNPGTDVAPRFYAGYDGGRLLKDQWFLAYPWEDLLEGADGEYGYGVVQEPVNGVGTSGGSGQRYEYRLVEANGKIADGRKKIRKDKAVAGSRS